MHARFVTPAQAGVQTSSLFSSCRPGWAPASAGVTI
jgi:hypothetical protein